MKKVKIPFSLDEYNKGGYEVETDVAGYHITILKTDAKGNEPIIGLCLIDEYEVPLAFNKKGEIANNSLNLVLVKYNIDDGDIVYAKTKGGVGCQEFIFVYGDKYKDKPSITKKNVHTKDNWVVEKGNVWSYDYSRIAAKGEKQKLFDMLATEKGLKWNDETKDFESIEDEKETNWVSSGIISTNEVIFRKEENGLRRGCFVLARDGKDQSWELDIFGRHDNEYTGGYTCVGGCYDYCIPFDSETEHLHGTTEDCPSKYKAWKD